MAMVSPLTLTGRGEKIDGEKERGRREREYVCVIERERVGVCM